MMMSWGDLFIYLLNYFPMKCIRFELGRERRATRRAETLLSPTTMSSKPLLPKTNPPQPSSAAQAEPKIRGANRSTKTAGKLKVLPDQPTTPGPATRLAPEPDEGVNATGDTDEGDDEEEEDDDEDDEEGAEGRLRQISRIPQGTARRDALRLTKKKAKSLPRVTAYATAQYVSPSSLLPPFSLSLPSSSSSSRLATGRIYFQSSSNFLMQDVVHIDRTQR